MNTSSPVHDGICPGCGQANQCGMAAPAKGAPAFDCWCMHTNIRPEALAALPPGERGQRCLCASCAQGNPPVHNGK